MKGTNKVRKFFGVMVVAVLLGAAAVSGGATAEAGHTSGSSYSPGYFECKSLPLRSQERADCFQEIRCARTNATRESWSDAQWDAYYAFIEATGFNDPCLVL